MSSELTAEQSMVRLRASNDRVTAKVREALADGTSELEVMGRMIVSNVSGSPVAVAGVAALTMLDLALAQAEIIRLRAELDGEKAAHKACHDGVRHAARGGG